MARTIDQRVIAATEILHGNALRPRMITAIEREFADVVTSDPRVLTLMAAAEEILRRPGSHKPERCPAGPANSTRCSQCELRAALKSFEK